MRQPRSTTASVTPQPPGPTPHKACGLAVSRRRDSASLGDAPQTPGLPPEAREAPRAERPRGRQ
jgi:hypothetical protein